MALFLSIENIKRVQRMTDNPFIAPILKMIRCSTTDLSEHQIMVQLERETTDFSFADDEPSVALFKKHFLIMNGLYQLQQTLLEDGLYLFISPLKICLTATCEDREVTLPDQGPETKLSDYYLDWRNFEQASGTSVNSLLSGFWQRYLAIDKRVEALQALDLPADASWESVKSAYQRLANQHHPDKGGEPNRFMTIREAYEILSRCYTR